MRLLVSLATLLSLAAIPAAAADFEFTQGLADVLAAEEFCGLSYDQAAIESFISDKVAPDDLEFTSSLKGLLYLAEVSQKEMTKSVATAHCTQVRRLARSYGFTG